MLRDRGVTFYDNSSVEAFQGNNAGCVEGVVIRHNRRKDVVTASCDLVLYAIGKKI